MSVKCNDTPSNKRVLAVKLNFKTKHRRLSDTLFNSAVEVAQKVLSKSSNAIRNHNWDRALTESKLSKSCLRRALARMSKGLSPRSFSVNGGRNKLITPEIIATVLRSSRQMALGDGHTLTTFIKAVEDAHAESESLKLSLPITAIPQLDLSNSCAKKYFQEIYPGVSSTDSKQNQARVNAVLNGCTSISHATNIYANIEILQQEPALIFNMDRSTLYLNASQKQTIRQEVDRVVKSKVFKQGASKSTTPGEEAMQQRTIHVDYLSSPGSPNYCFACIHIKDDGIEEGTFLIILLIIESIFFNLKLLFFHL